MTGAHQAESFEKQALSSVQEMLSCDLDADLPSRPFEVWFNQLVGPEAGVVWQLTECGEPIMAPGQTGQDLPACAEVNANLPDGRKVFVAISVGTFKKGLIGKPTFLSAVIEQSDQLYQTRRLSALPEMLAAPDDRRDIRLATETKTRTVNLPVIKADPADFISPLQIGLLSSFASIAPPMIRGSSPAEIPPPPPTPQQDPETVSEGVLQSRAITRARPVYPPSAKKMNAVGTVEVQITISEEGNVVEATAISGHIALRSAAVEAARKWVFKPTIFNGVPATTRSVLTFVFAPGSR